VTNSTHTYLKIDIRILNATESLVFQTMTLPLTLTLGLWENLSTRRSD